MSDRDHRIKVAVRALAQQANEQAAEIERLRAQLDEANRELDARQTELDAAWKEDDNAQAQLAKMRTALENAIRGLPDLLERNALIDEEGMISALQTALATDAGKEAAAVLEAANAYFEVRTKKVAPGLTVGPTAPAAKEAEDDLLMKVHAYRAAREGKGE